MDQASPLYSSSDDAEFFDPLEAEEEEVTVMTQRFLDSLYDKIVAAISASNRVAPGGPAPEPDRQTEETATTPASSPSPSSSPVLGHHQTFNFHNEYHGCCTSGNSDAWSWSGVALVLLIFCFLLCQFFAGMQQLGTMMEEWTMNTFSLPDYEEDSADIDTDDEHTDFLSSLFNLVDATDFSSWLPTLAPVLIAAGPTMAFGSVGHIPFWPFKA